MSEAPIPLCVHCRGRVSEATSPPRCLDCGREVSELSLDWTLREIVEAARKAHPGRLVGIKLLVDAREVLQAEAVPVEPYTLRGQHPRYRRGSATAEIVGAVLKVV